MSQELAWPMMLEDAGTTNPSDNGLISGPADRTVPVLSGLGATCLCIPTFLTLGEKIRDAAGTASVHIRAGGNGRSLDSIGHGNCKPQNLGKVIKCFAAPRDAQLAGESV